MALRLCRNQLCAKIVRCNCLLLNNKLNSMQFLPRYRMKSTDFDMKELLKKTPDSRQLGDDSFFHWRKTLENKEVFPIIILAVGGVICEMIYLLRLLVTRDDIRRPGRKMACEILDTRCSQLHGPPIRKNIVFYQKYEWPKGLMEAVQGSSE